jgi:hypothetical protein
MNEARGVIGVAAGLATSSTVASAGIGAKLGAAATLKWFGVWFAVAAISASVTLVARQRMRAAPAIVPVVENRMPAPAGEPVPLPASEPAAVDPGAPVESTATPSRPDRAAPSPKTLSAEVASLDSVKQFLVAGDPAAALNALAKYHASFPAPMLGPEATVLEVQALMAQGDAAHRARAIALARRFVKMHPTSPHASQLEALLSKAHAP